MFNKTNLWLKNTNVVRFMFFAAVITAFLSASQTANAQTYAPFRYWTFERSNPMLDSMNNYNMDPTYYQSPYTINTNPANVGVGKYMTLNGSSGMIKLGEFAVDTTITVEFLFRPGYLFNMTSFFKRIDGALEAQMGYPYISFYTNTNNYSGGSTFDELKVNLNQVGKRSYGYFMDGNWHHIVFTYNSRSGEKKIYIDGDCPDGYSKTVTPGYFINNTSVNRDVILNSQSTYLKYHGDYDEIAYYKYVLPPNQIYKHYQNLVAKQHYTFAASTTPPPAPAPVTAGFDMTEFAPGYPNVNVSATDQILTFPTPRYKTGNTLIPNVPLYGVEYLAGLLQPGVTYTQALNSAKVQQVELINKFNQSILAISNTHEYDMLSDTTKFAGWFTRYANQNPSKHTSAFSFWPQINPQIIGRASNEAYATCQCLSNNHYLRNSSGQFLTPSGSVTSQKYLSPAAPVDSLAYDGLTQKFYLQQLVTKLTRPLDIIFENGEVIPYILNSNVLAMDPTVVADKNSTGLDWYSYEGKRAKEKALAYKNQFMTIPQLANTKYAYFSVSGHPLWDFKYSEMRQVSSTINGQSYPTNSLYMRYPSNWRNWMSAWHGWQWLAESRKVELAAGDKLYSPPVSPGWDADDTQNVRPAQWLGMLKVFSMAGAEFFYTAFFNITTPYPDSKVWAWQVVLPAYAQAVTSRYEDLLRNGYLMEGDVPNDYINPAWNAYSFKSGDLRKLVVIRKHNSLSKYAITGTLQPNTSMMGNAENSGNATITLDGQNLKFKVRRQGSTYIYDKTNSSAPVFYQLDEWHEATHPYLWSKDFTFEAELFDNTNSNVVIKTTVPAGTPSGDYTNYTSRVTFNTASDVVYNFHPRKNAPTVQYLWVRARSKDGTSTGFNVSLDGGAANSFDCITDTNWVWYRYNTSNTAVSYSNLSAAFHELKLTAINIKIEIDKIVLTSNSGAVYGNVTNPCTTAQATITPGGPTSFCQGGNVSLTASNGTSYLWSNGATTKTIVVTNSGTYTVTVTTSGVGTSTSSPVTVTVNALPTASISASGATTFCTGGTVTLTASAGSSYLWSPGNQTSQSIAVTTAGTYNVRVTNANGCSAVSSNTTVNVNAVPTATITAGGATTFCQGGSVTLTSSTGSSYLWSPGNQTSQSITVSSGGTYSVRVTNSSGCTKVSSNTVVTVNSLPVATITPSGSLNIPQGGSVTLNSSSGSSYLWTPGGQTTQSKTVNTAGSYTVRVTNSNGCSATSAPAVVTVTTSGSATITPSGPTTFCTGGTVSLTANTGTAYLWSTGATTKTITTSSTGNYIVTVYNGSTPSVSAPTAVNVLSLPTATISASGSTSICSGSNITLTASSGSAYSWTPGGQNTQSIVVSSAGNYNVTVTGSNGCTKSATVVPVTVITCTGTCAPPVGLMTNNVGSNSATVSWSNPNSGQTEFQVKLKNMNTGFVYVAGKVPSTTTTLTVGANSSTNYRWWVRSWCGGNKSAYAGYLSFTTPSVRIEDPDETNPSELTPLFLSDEEGELQGSMVINLDESQIQLYPNPASSEASLSFHTPVDQKYTISILELNGKLINMEVIDAKEGYNIYSINTSLLAKGIYMVQINCGDTNSFKKLIVQ